MALRLVVTTIIFTLTLFFTATILPDVMGLSENGSMIVFMAIVSLVIVISNNNTAVNGASLVLSIPLFMAIVMFVY